MALAMRRESEFPDSFLQQTNIPKDMFGRDATTPAQRHEEFYADCFRLRKVMENRKKNQMLQRDPRQGRYLSNSAPRGNQYLNYGSINISPTTVTDPDGPTPSVSSSRSGTTRCVCANPDSEGFMIQWYALYNVSNVAKVLKNA